MITLPPVSDDEMRRLNAEASAKAGGQHPAYPKPRSIADLVARYDATGSTLSPHEAEDAKRRAKGWGRAGKPIHAADVPPRLPVPAIADWMAAVRAAAKQRKPGDPSYELIVKVAEVWHWLWRIQQRWSQERIGRHARMPCSDESVRQVQNYLYERQLLRWVHVMVRTPDGQFWRSANLYVPAFELIKGEARGWMRRHFEQAVEFLASVAPMLGLVERPNWLNTTPLRQPGET